MAPKRKPLGDGVGESPDEFAKPLGGTLDSSAEFTKPVYLVAVREDEQAAHSILKIDAAAAGNGQPRRVRTVSGLPGADPRMSFAAAHSKHGSWIVGVGGWRTIIFDPTTLETFLGPQLLHAKHKPVLISHGGELYAISSHPRVVGPIDCEPWFESLSFNREAPSKDSNSWFSWAELPPPPFFPCLVNPYSFRYPPEISVSSYAVVGSYILISPEPERAAGTHAFHVVNKTWEKVHDKNLPFVGQAVPLGGSLFAACPISNNCIAASASASVFNMSIKVCSSSACVPAVSTPSLSIKEFKVVTSDKKIPWPLLCPLGEGGFCCIRLASAIDRGSRKAKYLKEAQVILTTFQIKNSEAIMTHCQSQGSNTKDLLLTVQVEKQRHPCKSKGLFGKLRSGWPVVAALSMDTETVELGDEKTETTASLATDSTVFEAPVIPMCG